MFAQPKKSVLQMSCHKTAQTRLATPHELYFPRKTLTHPRNSQKVRKSATEARGKMGPKIGPKWRNSKTHLETVDFFKKIPKQEVRCTSGARIYGGKVLKKHRLAPAKCDIHSKKCRFRQFSVVK